MKGSLICSCNLGTYITVSCFSTVQNNRDLQNIVQHINNNKHAAIEMQNCVPSKLNPRTLNMIILSEHEKSVIQAVHYTAKNIRQ